MNIAVVTAPRSRVYMAFAVVSIVWGSTYLAIRVGVQEMPPFWMAGVRLMIAGLLLGGYALIRGQKFPTDLCTWGWLLLSGVLVLGIALGGMFWAEQHIDSGLAALLTCMSPLLMALYGSLGAEGDRLTVMLVGGLVIGLVGVGILIDPKWTASVGRVPLYAVGVIIVGGNAWSGGSVLAKRTLKAVPPLVSSAVHSLAGAVFLLLLDLIVRGGSWPHASIQSWVSLAYLVLFGSIIAYSAYIYLITHMAPARAGTFTYINPIVALFLGWLVLGEEITWRIVVGGSVILLGLFIVRRSKLQPRVMTESPQEPVS